MRKIIFLVLCGLVFLPPQLVIRLKFFGMNFGLDLVLLLVIYAGFYYPFGAGLISVLILALLPAPFGLAPYIPLAWAALVLFVVIQGIRRPVFAEAYITKSLWVLFFSFLGEFLVRLVVGPGEFLFGDSFFWGSSLLQSVIHAFVSFPLFILLDGLFHQWTKITSRKQAELTGADLFQVKSKQRKYF